MVARRSLTRLSKYSDRIFFLNGPRTVIVWGIGVGVGARWFGMTEEPGMAGFRKPKVAREQFVLWSQRLEDAIPSDHPVRLFDQLIGSAAFAATFREWEQAYVGKEGQPAYHPRVLVGLYLYGMLNRIRSSRQLESASYNRLDVIWLLSGETPDHSTIAPF